MREEIGHALRRDESEIFDGAKLLDGCFLQSLQRAVMCRESRRRYLANVANTKRVNEAFKACILRFFNSVYEILSRFLAHSFHFSNIFYRERIEICRIGNESGT